jgi:hypothetical protein
MATVIIGLACVGLPSVAHAQRADDSTWIRAGAYFPDIDTEVSIALPGQEDFATLIDLESDLDLSDRDALPAFSAGTRISQHWRVEGEFFKLSRSGEKSLERDITFDGVTYPVSASVESGFSSDIYRLSFGYSFIRKAGLEAGAAIGIHATNFEVSLRGQAQVGNAGLSTELRKRDVLAPLPTLGLYGSIEALPGLALGGRVDYFSLKIDDYDGKLVNFQTEASYALTNNIRIGAMYRHVKYRVDIEKPNYTGRTRYKFNGPAAFLEVAF